MYTCINVHTHSSSFHDNKDLCVGAATYQRCIENNPEQYQLNHLKMMRLLFLCLLLLRAAVSDEREGSGDPEIDDEDLTTVSGYSERNSEGKVRLFAEPKDYNGHSDGNGEGTVRPFAEAKGEGHTSDKLTVIIIVVAATVLALSVAVIVTVLLVRRCKHNQQQGKYTVPTDQDKKEAV